MLCRKPLPLGPTHTHTLQEWGTHLNMYVEIHTKKKKGTKKKKNPNLNPRKSAYDNSEPAGELSLERTGVPDKADRCRRRCRCRCRARSGEAIFLK